MEGGWWKMKHVLLACILCPRRSTEMPASPCSLAPPDDLTPNPAVRPRSLPPWGAANLTAFGWRKGHDLLFVPQAPPPADGWYGVIRASQFPSVCGRYLLLEDDLSTAGLGWSAVCRHCHYAIAPAACAA